MILYRTQKNKMGLPVRMKSIFHGILPNQIWLITRSSKDNRKAKKLKENDIVLKENDIVFVK
jgi:hypothetical protein